MKTLKLWLLGACGVVLLINGCGGGNTGGRQSANVSSAATDQEVSDAYIYLMGRLLVLRQQQADFQEGFQWNTMVHRKSGAVADAGGAVTATERGAVGSFLIWRC